MNDAEPSSAEDEEGGRKEGRVGRKAAELSAPGPSNFPKTLLFFHYFFFRESFGGERGGGSLRGMIVIGRRGGSD